MENLLAVGTLCKTIENDGYRNTCARDTHISAANLRVARKVVLPKDHVLIIPVLTRPVVFPLKTFAEQVLLERIHDEGTQAPNSSVADAARRLGTLGKRHGLSLGGMTIRELLNESRP